MNNIDFYTRYFKNPEAFGTILYKMGFKVLGDNYTDWEMDTIHMELNRLYGAIPECNMDKLLSIVALSNSFKGQLCFFNEMNCFRHTVNALNNHPADYDFLGALVPQFAHWAVWEVKQLYSEYDLDEEPAKFMALSYHHCGNMLLPDDLSKYQSLLDSYNHNIKIIPRIKEYIAEHKNDDLDKLNEFDLLDAQLLHYLSDKAYMDLKKTEYASDLEMLDLNAST